MLVPKHDLKHFSKSDLPGFAGGAFMIFQMLFNGFEALGLCADCRYRRELSIDVLYVTTASIYAELWPKQVLHRKVL